MISLSLSKNTQYALNAVAAPSGTEQGHLKRILMQGISSVLVDAGGVLKYRRIDNA